jgi:FMN phosphatase YigB (HAD superfamily)
VLLRAVFNSFRIGVALLALPLSQSWAHTSAFKRVSCKTAAIGYSARVVEDYSELIPVHEPIRSLAIDLDNTLIPESRSKLVAAKFVGRLWSEIRAEYLKIHPKHSIQANLPTLRVIWGIQRALRSAHESLSIESQMTEVVTKEFQIPHDEASRLVLKVVGNAYDVLRPTFGTMPGAESLMNGLKDQGFQMVLATTPRWPLALVQERMKKGRIRPEDFSGITSWEQHRAAKPHDLYYQELITQHALKPGLTLMIGNDLAKDCLPALRVGMSAFWFVEDLEQVIEFQKRSSLKPGFYAGTLEHLGLLLQQHKL